MVSLKTAAENLKNGNLVAFPTETVYGLGADASNALAVSKIFKVKNRPIDHPLIVHIFSSKQLSDWAIDIPEFALKLAKDFWPGPMTLIFKSSPLAKDFITGGQSTIGLRVPRHPIALELLKEFLALGGLGIAAPSANRFGKVSPTSAQAVHEELDQYLSSNDLVLDGGNSEVGIESTIIDCTNPAPRVLRPGAISESMIKESTGLALLTNGKEIRVSGNLESHYAPVAQVLLDIEPVKGDGYIALNQYQTPTGVIRLAEPRNHLEFAQTLYSALRQADQLHLTRIVVKQPEGDELAMAICDRLKKASSK